MASITIGRETVSEVALPNRNNQYIEVPLAILIGLPDLRCDVYIQHPITSQKLLYRSANSDLPVDLETLRKRNVRHLYLRAADEIQYQQAMRVALAKPPDHPAVQLLMNAEQHRETFEIAFRSSCIAPAVQLAETIADGILQVLHRDDFAMSEIVALLGHDRCTFQHSCNVSIYAATLAKSCGISDAELKLLTCGGVLHDVGKRHIPSHILRKPGKLDEREREIIRQHPTLSFRELAVLRQLNWGQLMMTYQHHERDDGHGYPVGVSGDEMHLWARICAIVDVFDALTASRPYRESGHASDALEIMTKDAGHYDQELFDLWVEIASP